jgi:acetyl esterase/lipase
MLGHSSGGGLAVRFAGGTYGAMLSKVVLLAPFLQYDAPTTRPNAGGWAHPLTRRIIGISMLNKIGITALNGLHIISFAFPRKVLDGPEGDTATTSYSYRLNASFAPRRNYLRDVAALPEFCVITGADDNAYAAEAYEPLMSAVNPRGTYHVLPGEGHLDIVRSPTAARIAADFLLG